MNEKEISEIRRRFRADKSNITHVRGCYVNEKQEIVSQFDQPLSLLPQEECENMLSVLRRTLSGTLGKNLIEMSFTTAQVVDSDEHRLLMALRDSKLTDEEAVRMFFEKVIASYRPEGTYLILLANDTYDVPYRAKDGETLEDASENIYNYIQLTTEATEDVHLCCISMDIPDMMHMTMEQTRYADKLWDAAEEAVADDAVRLERVQRSRISFEFWKLGTMKYIQTEYFEKKIELFNDLIKHGIWYPHESSEKIGPVDGVDYPEGMIPVSTDVDRW